MATRKQWWKDLPPEMVGDPAAEMPEGGIGQQAPGAGGYTGLGPDGQLQSERRVPGIGEADVDKHEGEWVFNADEAQAIGPDVLKGIAQAVKDGKLDVNQLREAIGQAPRQGMQAGTLADRQLSQTRPDPPAQPRGMLPSGQYAPFTAGLPRGTPDPAPTDDPLSEMAASRAGGTKTSLGMWGAAMPTDKTVAGKKTVGPQDPLYGKTPEQLAALMGKGGVGADAAGAAEELAAKQYTPPTKTAMEMPDFSAGLGTVEKDAEAVAMDVPTPGEVREPIAMDRDVTGELMAGVTVIDKSDEPLIGDPDIINAADNAGQTPEEYLTNVMNGEVPDAAAAAAIRRQGGAAAAALAGMKQELAQSGVGAMGRATLTQQQVRAMEGGKSDLFGKLAGNAQQRADDAAKTLLAEEGREEALDWAKEKYGDQEFGRMATDITNGMTWDQAKAKYSTLTQEDFTKVQNHVNYQANKEKINDAVDALGDYTSKFSSTDPNWFTQDKWMSDPSALNRLGDLYEAEGFGPAGDFDISDPSDIAWARAQMEPYTLSAVELEMNQIKGSEWYMNLPDADKGEIDNLMNFSAMMSVTGGYDLGENADGSLYLVDSQGDVVYGSKAPVGTGLNTPTGGVTTQSVTDAVEELGNAGVTATTNRVRQYMLEHDGTAPTADQFLQWDASAGDPLNVLRYFNGDATATLTNADRGLIGKILAAKDRVDADPGNATTEDLALARQLPVNMATMDWNTVPNTETRTHTWYESDGYGNLHRSTDYNNQIYGQTASDHLNMKDSVRQWVMDNKGGVVQIEGTWYRMDPTQPIAEDYVFDSQSVLSNEEVPYTQTFKADALVLRPLDDPDNPVYYTWGAKGHLSD